ncbi:MAG TPA: hypothetical protein PKA27_10890 [Fimbriimonadaceae bacterium]|nr:hypothetical protein [Fimbriimonadaceae bacterium]
MVVALLVVGLQSLDAKIASVLPTREESKYMSIPWRLDLNTARAQAQESGKPLFIWVMNGHPMGCT